MPRQATSIGAGAVLLATLAFAPTASARMPSPCSLLTKGEVAKVIHAKRVARSTEKGECVWSARARQVVVGITKEPRARFVKRSSMVLAGGRSPNQLRLEANARVHGVGQIAYLFEKEELFVWWHGYALDVSVITGAVESQAAKALAQKALARL